MAFYYADTSALSKLLVPEAESTSLREWLRDTEIELVTNVVSRIELVRVARRHGDDLVADAHVLLRRLFVIPLSSDHSFRAGMVDPASLRSLDAIHLSTALTMGEMLKGMLTYDKRLADACALYGVEVIAPS